MKTASAEIHICKIPKRVKFHIRKQQQTQGQDYSDIVAVGDNVVFEPNPNEEDEGLITEVLPRRSVLSRARPSAGGRSLQQDREQILIANLDQVIFVFSAASPSPSLRKLDRLLVAAERQKVAAVICINKMDLVDLEETKEKFAWYEQIGYTMVYTSIIDGTGIEEIQSLLTDKISCFSGSSGVGKSSLLNAVQPKLGLQVGAVSEATTKGMHTTRYTELFPLRFGGYVADTPGIRGVALFNLDRNEIDAYFREFQPYIGKCRYRDCTHVTTKGCAIRRAVKDREIPFARYDSYRRLRAEHEQLYQDEF